MNSVLLIQGFIASGETLLVSNYPYREGDIVLLAPYAEDGEIHIGLRIDNLVYDRIVDSSGNWQWRIGFELVNIGELGVVYKVYQAVVGQ